MQMIISIVLFIAANLIPSDALELVIGVPNGRDITWVKQDSGGWRIKKDTKNQVGTWSVNGTLLVGKVQGRELPSDMSKRLSISSDTDWQTVSKIEMGKDAFHIQRHESSVTISHQEPNATGGHTETKYTITWTMPKD